MHLQGLPGVEIAKRLGVTKQAISKRLKAALAKIDGANLQAYRNNKTDILEGLLAELLSELVNPARLQKASLNNLAYAAAQVHTILRLESNQSTANLSLAATVAAVEKKEMG